MSRYRLVDRSAVQARFAEMTPARACAALVLLGIAVAALSPRRPFQPDRFVFPASRTVH
jgi:hypothetical protein